MAVCIIRMQYTQVKVSWGKVNLCDQRVMVTYPDIFREGNAAAIVAWIGKISIDMHDIQLAAGCQPVVNENVIECL
ncbi:hypothetical protein D3C75_1309410 [compost metagenome]